MGGMGTNYELGTLLELENKALINIQFNKLLACSMYYFVLSKSKRICPEGGKYWVGHKVQHLLGTLSWSPLVGVALDGF